MPHIIKNHTGTRKYNLLFTHTKLENLWKAKVRHILSFMSVISIYQLEVYYMFNADLQKDNCHSDRL